MNLQDDTLFNFKISISLLTRKSVSIPFDKDIAKKKSFLKLVTKFTKDTKYRTDKLILHFTPGTLVGGNYEYKCTDEIFNYIAPLLFVLPFTDKKTFIKFYGITDKLNCIDIIRIAYFPMINIFKVPGLDLVVKKRGFYPEGQGEVNFSCGVIKEFNCIDIVTNTCLEKTRALLISSRLNSTYVHSMSKKLKDLLGDLNFKIFSNIYNRNDSGPSPGFQCTIFAESKTGIYYVTKDGNTCNPENLAEDTAKEFLKTIKKGGIFDQKLNDLLFTFLAFSSTDVSRIRISKISDTTKTLLEYLRATINFRYEILKSSDGYIFTCYGSGYINYNIKLN